MENKLYTAEVVRSNTQIMNSNTSRYIHTYINSASDAGYFYLITPFLSEEKIVELKEKNYIVQKKKDKYGIIYYFICWYNFENI